MRERFLRWVRALLAFGRRPRVKRGVIITVAAGLLASLGLVAAAYLVPLPDRLVAQDSVVVTWNDGNPAHVFLSADDRWRIHTPLEDVDPDYVEALIRFEDKRFRSHMGVDPLAITRSAAVNVMHGRRLTGASTLTMQLVRLLEPRPRTYRSKVIEAFRAFQLEMHMSKDEILANYLRFAPYGRNIEGVEAASLSYFGHRANELSPEEIATLLAVPQNPNGRYPSARNHDALKRNRDEIAEWLFEEGGLEKGSDGDALSAKQFLAQIRASGAPSELRPFPREVPHVAYWLRAQHPQMKRLETTLDAGRQAIVEAALSRHEDSATEAGIRHAGVVVLDHESGNVVALVGNFRFDNSPGAQLPSFALPRSTGSLMKPFLYAMAIERGVAHPEQLVVDVPVQAGSYAPKNYDGSFRGLVKLEDALSESLNVPFVHLLATVKVRPFLEHLTLLGAEHINHAPGWYGLSAAVGGVEMTPLEVASLYASLANNGVWNAPRLVSKRRTEADFEPVQAFEPGSSWLTRQTLGLRDRPDFSRRREVAEDLGVHWKTGTSYGHRDAWAAGSGNSYTAVVWMGNHNRTPSTGLVGARRSGPALFDVLEALESDSTEDPRTDDLTEIEVCAYSGHLPTEACTHTKTAWALEKSVPVERCPYHTRVDIDVATGRTLAPNCRHGREYRTETRMVWPSAVRRHLANRYRYGTNIPALMEGCEPADATRPPQIVSPPSGQDLVLIPGLTPDQQEVPLEAETAQAGRTINWFVNGEFLASAQSHERVWWTPSPGEHELVAMDDSGRASRREVTVRSR